MITSAISCAILVYGGAIIDFRNRYSSAVRPLKFRTGVLRCAPRAGSANCITCVDHAVFLPSSHTTSTSVLRIATQRAYSIRSVLEMACLLQLGRILQSKINGQSEVGQKIRHPFPLELRSGDDSCSYSSFSFSFDASQKSSF